MIIAIIIVHHAVLVQIVVVIIIVVAEVEMMEIVVWVLLWRIMSIFVMAWVSLVLNYANFASLLWDIFGNV